MTPFHDAVHLAVSITLSVTPFRNTNQMLISVTPFYDVAQVLLSMKPFTTTFP